MALHNVLGQKGEELAREFLIKQGCSIRHCNWRYKKNEIDIIAEKDNFLLVVEVKTRSNDYFESPKEAVTKQKQKFIVQATEAYINEFNISYEVRFDVIAITVLKTEYKIEHIEDAFSPNLL